MQVLNTLPDVDSAQIGGACTPILVIDDDEFSVMSVLRAAKSVDIVNPIIAMRDASTALAILRDWLGSRLDLPPLVILLDLNMPGMNGLEFLDELRSDPVLHSAHVFMYSTSSLLSEITAAYDRNVAGYIVKGSDQLATRDVVRLLESYTKTIHFAA